MGNTTVTTAASSSTLPSSFAASAVYSITLPDGTDITMGSLIEILRRELPLRTRNFNITQYKNCCLGSDIVRAIQTTFTRTGDIRDAIQFARYLQYRNVIRHVCDDDHPIEDTQNEYFYRLQCHHTPWILNSYCVWFHPSQGRKRRNVHEVVWELYDRWTSMEHDATRLDPDGLWMVGYREMMRHPSFPDFEEAIRELQTIDMGKLEESHRIAFSINLYNLTIRYAFVKLGFPNTLEKRQSFLSSVKVRLGADVLSFYDLEYGVLLGNQKIHHHKSQLPFGPANGRKDPRLRLAVRKVDPRVHFALYRGHGGHTDGTSDQPQSRRIEYFTATNIDQELRAVAEAYCRRDDAVSLDPSGNRVFLHKSFESYAKDRRLSHIKLLSHLGAFLPKGSNDAALLKRMIPKKPSVVFREYQWKPANADSFRLYDISRLKVNVKGRFLKGKKKKKRKKKRNSTGSAPDVSVEGLLTDHHGYEMDGSLRSYRSSLASYRSNSQPSLISAGSTVGY